VTLRALLHKNGNFWTKDRSLTALFAYIVLNTFVLVPFTHSRFGEISHSVIYSMILISGVFSMGATLKAKVSIVILAIFSFMIRWLSILYPTTLAIDIVDDVCSILFLTALATFVLWHIFKDGDITFHRIQGAITTYLIVGLAFSKAFHLIFLLDNHAFIMPILQQDSESYYSRFVYFSYVTLTTLGFGDITPVNLGAKSLVMIEGLIGQLYPAIMITRLVTLELETKKRKTG
jgi:Ion channel